MGTKSCEVQGESSTPGPEPRADALPSYSEARVCFLSYCSSIGGIANYQALQMEYLCQKVPVLFLGEKPRNTFKSLGRFAWGFVETVTAPVWSRPRSSARVVWRVLAGWRPSAVVVSNLGLMVVWAPLLRWLRWRTGCSIVHVYHSRRTTPSLKGYVLELLTSLAHLNASDAVYVSQFTRKSWESSYPWMRGSAARVVPNAVHLGTGPLRDVPGSSFSLGFVGRFEEEKGVRLFCEIARASKEEGLPFRFQLFGDGSLRDSVEAEFGSFVQCRGVEHDRDEIFRQIDALVVTSRIENAPYAVLEAKARGIPVVSARIGGVPEMVEQGGDGIICEVRTVASYLTAIKELFARYEELRAGCLKNRSRFDFNTRAAEMWAPVLSSALSQGLPLDSRSPSNCQEQTR